MQKRSDDTFVSRDHAEIPGRPNLYDGSASNDVRLNQIALRRLARYGRVRGIVMPHPERREIKKEEKKLTPREIHRQEMVDKAIEFLKDNNSLTIETAMTANKLAKGMRVKTKAVAGFLKYAVIDGVIKKVTKSVDPNRPSVTLVHFYLGHVEDENEAYE